MFYDYICSNCEHHEEKIHGMNETPIFECPECNTIMKRIIYGGSGTHYKGIGWSSNGTALAPRAVRQKIRELHAPAFLKKAIRK